MADENPTPAASGAKKERNQLTHEFQKYLQAAEAALRRLGKIRGSYDPLVIEAARETLHGRVDAECARIPTTDQLTLFTDLERRAKELRNGPQPYSWRRNFDLVTNEPSEDNPDGFDHGDHVDRPEATEPP